LDFSLFFSSIISLINNKKLFSKIVYKNEYKEIIQIQVSLSTSDNIYKEKIKNNDKMILKNLKMDEIL
jgi:hypothetical protein